MVLFLDMLRDEDEDGDENRIDERLVLYFMNCLLLFEPHVVFIIYLITLRFNWECILL